MKKPKGEQNLKFKNGKWYLDFTFKGKRHRPFGGFTKEQAKNTLAKFRIELLDEKLGFKKSNTGEPILFEKHADEVLELYSKKNKRSWARDELSLASFKRFFKGQMIQNVGSADIERFKVQRSAEFKRDIDPKKKIPISPATVNRELAFLKTVFNKAVEWGRLENNPAARVKKFREDNIKERILTDAEARQLIEACGPDLRPVIIIALNTGMRRTEILGLRWKNVDLRKGFIHIGVADSKSGRSRNVPINYAVFETLKGLP
jgi:integrase